MHSSLFFRLFPPPKYMAMRFAGLDISDDAIHCLNYTSTDKGLAVGIHDFIDMPPGLMEAGEIKDEKAFKKILTEFDKKNDLSYVKVSVSEEKAYLFQTDILSSDTRAIRQNIESKLEENVPLSAADAVFYFDHMPEAVTGGASRASVSVVPKSYIEKYIETLRSAGIYPIAFEVVPKSIAKAVIPLHTEPTAMIIHIMKKKTGIYIVSGGVVCFTSTITWGSRMMENKLTEDVAPLALNVNRTYSYWMARGIANSVIDRVVMVGRDAPQYEKHVTEIVADAHLSLGVANIWQNSFDLNHYIPPISKDDSLDFAVAAGLALD